MDAAFPVAANEPFYPDPDGILQGICDLCGMSFDYCTHVTGGRKGAGPSAVRLARQLEQFPPLLEAMQAIERAAFFGLAAAAFVAVATAVDSAMAVCFAALVAATSATERFDSNSRVPLRRRGA